MLGYFIQHDVKQDGCHVLRPFLGTQELLNLATCCRSLKLYRHYLQDFYINYFDSLNAYKKRLLHSILTEQYCPRSIVVRDSRVFPIFFSFLKTQYYTKHVKAVCFQPVKKPDVNLTSYLKKEVRNGAFRQLVCLSFYNFDCDFLVDILTSRICPRLRSLCFDYCFFQSPASLGMVVAYLPNLRRLAIRKSICSTISNYSLISCVALAIKCHANRPVLRYIEFTDLWTIEWDAIWLAESIQHGAFSQVRALIIRDCNLNNIGCSVLFRSMSEDTLTHLHTLFVRRIGVGHEAIQTFKALVCEKRLPSINLIALPCEDQELECLLRVLYPSINFFKN